MPAVLVALFILVRTSFTTCDWAIGVATERQVDLLNTTGSRVASGAHGMIHINTLNYDPIFGHLYFSDTSQQDTSLFRMEVSKDGRTSKAQPLVIDLVNKTNNLIEGIAYEPITSTLLWTTGIERSIMRAVLPKNSTKSKAEVIHKFELEVPHGIAVDPCTGYVFWTNCYISKPSIERSFLNGTKREIIVSSLLFQPLGITVSQSDRMIYWVDARANHYYSVERATLNGLQRQTVVYAAYQQPIGLAVASGIVYWTDWTHNAVWSVELKKGVHLPLVEPKAVKSYDLGSPRGIVARHQYEILVEGECRNLINLKTKVPSRGRVLLGTCLHGLPNQNGSCTCAAGYSGTHCETSLCHNYCLDKGVCSLSSDWEPVCSCPPLRTGRRCEIDLCPPGFCRNGSPCLVDEDFRVSCTCLPGFFGKWCHLSTPVCKAYCETREYPDDPIAQDCPCHIWPEALALTKSSTEGELRPYQIACFSLAVISALLIPIIIFLIYKVLVLRARPRLIRKYQVTPHKANDQCEIAIENCCNMNICETPCYEPEFRTSGYTKVKKEEKRTLLNNIEIQPDLQSCSANEGNIIM